MYILIKPFSITSKLNDHGWMIFRSHFLTQSDSSMFRIYLPKLQSIGVLLHNKQLFAVLWNGKMTRPNVCLCRQLNLIFILVLGSLNIYIIDIPVDAAIRFRTGSGDIGWLDRCHDCLGTTSDHWDAMQSPHHIEVDQNLLLNFFLKHSIKFPNLRGLFYGIILDTPSR